MGVKFMFSGPEYQKEFESACGALVGEDDPVQVRRVIMNVEWVLWEATRGVFGSIALTMACLIVGLPAFLLDLPKSLLAGATVLVLVAAITIGIYWLCRLIFHWEIARHVVGRKFGEGGFSI